MFRELAVLVTHYHLHYFRIGEMRPETILKTLEKLDAFRRPERFEKFIVACEADSRGRAGYENHQPEQSDLMRRAYQAAAAITAIVLEDSGLQGAELGKAINQQRIASIAETLDTSLN